MPRLSAERTIVYFSASNLTFAHTSFPPKKCSPKTNLTTLSQNQKLPTNPSTGPPNNPAGLSLPNQNPDNSNELNHLNMPTPNNQIQNYAGIVNSRLPNQQKSQINISNMAIGMNMGMGLPMSTQINSNSNVNIQNQNIHNNPMYQNNSNANLSMMNQQLGIDNRIVYPASQHHQLQLAIHQRSRASATPHHHAKTAMAIQRNQANFAAMFPGNNLNISSYHNSSADLSYPNNTTIIPDENGPNIQIGGSSQHGILIRSPTGGKPKQTGKKTPITPQLLRSSTVGANTNMSGLSRITKSVEPNSIPSSALNNGKKDQKDSWDALDLGGMGLRSISNELFKYTFLVKLYINHNQLTFIPSSISNLRNLETLDASGNQITSVPYQLGLCCKLKELLLFDNRITELPFELGNLYQLETLGLEGNPTADHIRQLLQKDGTRAVIEYLRDVAPASKSPDDRRWIVLDKSVDQNSKDIITNISYNVLCSKYATPQSYGYCPSWALDWESRRETIISELLSLSADIICLQEVETSEYKDFFCTKLKPAGYEGIFWVKSRARTMSESERKSVDGCATFYKSESFTLIASHLLEFQPSALKRADFKKSEDFFNRFMTKDNICGFGVLKHKHIAGNPMLVVTNAHIHWDPEFTDVKMVQVAMLMEELGKVVETYVDPNFSKVSGSLSPTSTTKHPDSTTSKLGKNDPKLSNVPKYGLLICGDFNSTPESGLYEFLSSSKLPKTHQDLSKLESYSDYAENGLSHKFSLKSSYSAIGEMELTNFTPHFRGAIDYIWYSTNTLQPTGLLGPIDPEWLSQQVGFPNAHIPSDHIPLMAEFKFRS
ncbi:hypothetical protein BB559_002641 [Furculomyces boomerangus]|uniref:poly(A)-specific ribonuclease n=1 Tax=Furculomyces boomerangus TaxID=61424 RepID=A0A2T9YTJ7_9FUNG|nr:hypothetical protein BB559_002641 [Furculomyces boomerangus]